MPFILHIALSLMRKFYLTLIAVIAMIQFSFGQWSNVSVTNNISNTNTGNVGIGTTTPNWRKFVGQGKCGKATCALLTYKNGKQNKRSPINVCRALLFTS